jgi:hypothetical protein
MSENAVKNGTEVCKDAKTELISYCPISNLMLYSRCFQCHRSLALKDEMFGTGCTEMAEKGSSGGRM